MYFTQAIESVNSIPLANQRITYSFWARAGANYSAASSVLTATARSGTGTDQTPYGGYTGSNNFAVSNVNLTTTWTRFTVTGDVPNNCSELLIQFENTPVGTAGVNDYYEVTGVQINIGSVSLPFRTYDNTIQGELAACQRYYYRTAAPNQRFGLSFVYSTTVAYGVITFPSEMRVAPTTLDTTGTAGNYGVTGGATFYTNTVVPAFDIKTKNYASIGWTNAGTMTVGQAGFMTSISGSPYLGFSAEL
jgi:hypothetical protein